MLDIVFMGTPELARVVLASLLASRHRVVAVVSQPDRPKGRGKELQRPPVGELAAERGLPLLQPEATGSKAFRDWVASHRPDVAVVAAFGHILGPKALAIPRLGCVNVHVSLLPRWRGASPIQRAVEAGDAETGVSIMRMDAGMDTGPVYAMERLAIAPTDTAETLAARAAELGGRALLPVLDALDAGTAVATPQSESGLTIAPMLGKDDADLDWSLPAVVLERRVRAYHPWPGTRTLADGKVVRVLPLAEVGPPAEAGVPPGTVVRADPKGIAVACGDGATLVLQTLQAEGRKVLAAGPFLQGFPLRAGMRLGAWPS
ncbi:MAG: methionyl-tRNA formyltransferase [Myxococcota bacterium]